MKYLFYIILLTTINSCRHFPFVDSGSHFPVYFSEDMKRSFVIEENNSINIILEVTTESYFSDTSYTIPVIIKTINNSDDSAKVIFKGLYANLENIKDGNNFNIKDSINRFITLKSNEIYSIKINLIFYEFNKSKINKIKDFEKYRLNIVIDKIQVNEKVLLDKNAFFICRTH